MQATAITAYITSKNMIHAATQNMQKTYIKWSASGTGVDITRQKRGTQMARTKIVPKEGLLSDIEYTSVVVSYSDGIDSTGALYWACQNFQKEKIYLLYCDTGCEYPENTQIFYRVAAFLKVTPVLLKDDRGFLGLLLNERLKFPDMKNRWCTAYLKTAVTDHWIRTHRQQLGTKCLFLSGERRDESAGRAKLPEIEYHSTTLKTTRVADFTCHWYRPCLDYEKGIMFEWGKALGIPPHPCYEYIGRCSCMFCMFMPDRHAAENMKRYPELAAEYVRAEMQIQHTWKKSKSLQSVFNECMDIDDVSTDIKEDTHQITIEELLRKQAKERET